MAIDNGYCIYYSIVTGDVIFDTIIVFWYIIIRALFNEQV